MDNGNSTRIQSSNNIVLHRAYSKAFDNVDHAALWNVLRDMGFPDHFITLLHNLYADQEATVRAGQGETQPFAVEKCVRQGMHSVSYTV